MRVPDKKWVGYVVLASGLLLVALARYRLSDYAEWEMPARIVEQLHGGYVLVVLGLFAIFAKFLSRFVRNFAAGETLRITKGLDHESVEDKRRQRLPLRAKRSAMADFGLLGALTVVAIIFPVYLMQIASWSPHRGIYVKVPPAREIQPSPAVRNTPIVVSVLRGKEAPRYLLNGKEVPADQFEREIRNLLATRGEWTVFVEGDPNMAFSDVVYACDTINTLGGHPVLLTPKMREEAADRQPTSAK